ncbi:MAG: UDP-N-acetylmuramate dehydrogenase [bacterium]|nr:UDP-N-acetylmuramate dehydrogenase [bacterium]
MISGFKKNILLADHTTIDLGGEAEYFIECKNIDEILSALKFTTEKCIRTQIISGGSNVIFADSGFNGAVIKIDTKGIKFVDEGEIVYAHVQAGENWDEFVSLCVENNLQGIECMSGIPGSAGATVVQNVGAYGQEVRETIVSVKAIEKDSLKEISFTNIDCKFEYRSSVFKNEKKDKYIITEVIFRLKKNAEAVIRYKELQDLVDKKFHEFKDPKDKLIAIRNSVLALRKAKSMLVDKSDPNSRSCGSFFLNPLLSEEEFKVVQMKTRHEGKELPFYRNDSLYKISAAWLVEHAGFHKGFRFNDGVGISENHSLAIISTGGSSADVVLFAESIRKKVKEMFGVTLTIEPVILI